MSEKGCPPPENTPRIDVQTTATRIDVLLLVINEKLQQMSAMVLCFFHTLYC